MVVYSNVSSGCDLIDIIEVPLDDPSAASVIGAEPLEHPCHDMGVILGDVMQAACAGGDGYDQFSLGGPMGGSLDDPMHIRHVDVPAVTIGHSAAWSWDGKVIIFGHEPGGGVAAACEATDPALDRSFFFYSAATGALLGTWTLPRTQGPTENCTLHNYNVIPMKKKRILVSGNYQAGMWVVDFTNPAAAFTVAWSDPPPKPVPPGRRSAATSPARGRGTGTTASLRDQHRRGPEHLQAAVPAAGREEPQAHEPANAGVLLPVRPTPTGLSRLTTRVGEGGSGRPLLF